MKLYKYNGEIIRQDELTEVVIPKVGQKLRFTKDRFDACNQAKIGGVVTVTEVFPRHKYFYTTRLDHDRISRTNNTYILRLDTYDQGMEIVPDAPEYKGALNAPPDGSVYLGDLPPDSNWRVRYKSCHGEPWVDVKVQEPDFYKSDGGWHTKGSPNVKYADDIGSEAHRAQPWFFEDEESIRKAATAKKKQEYLKEIKKIQQKIKELY
jgi:hypothetical protein